MEASIDAPVGGDADDRYSLDCQAGTARSRGDAGAAERAWTASPARVLLNSLDALEHLGQRDLPWPSILRAAGREDAEPVSARRHSWRVLYSTGPGDRLLGFDGETVDAVDSEIVGAALSVSAFGRAATLGRLLDQAALSPSYRAADGRQRDLRESLPVLVARLLTPPSARDADREIREAYLALETAILRLVARRADDLELRDLWLAARWLLLVVVHARRTVGSLEATAAWIDSLPGVGRPAVSVDDALHPGRFLEGPDRVSLSQFAWMEAIVGHHLRMGELRRDPWVCPPLLRWLRSVAGIGCSPSEKAMEHALAEGKNACGWKAPHIAPPLVARWLLTRLREPWLAEVSGAAFDECSELLRVEPRRLTWLCSAALHASKNLPEQFRRSLGVVWRSGTSDAIPYHLRATLAVAVVDVMDVEDLNRLADQISRAEPRWRPFVLDSLVDAAVRAGRYDVGKLAERSLRSLIADEDIDPPVRVNGAVLLAQRHSVIPWIDKLEFASWFSTVASRPPLSESLAVRRELDRTTNAGSTGRQ